MSTLPRLTAVAAVGLLAALGTAPAALASVDQACSEYAEACDDGGVDGTSGGAGDTGTGGTSGTGGTAGTAGGTGSGLGTAPDSLPLTGGEAVLLALGGTGALAAGTALVVASRRRTT